MDQTVNLGAVVPKGRCVIGSKDVSALKDGKGSSVREKVKPGNTVVRSCSASLNRALLLEFLP
jgi:hypothetical protein